MMFPLVLDLAADRIPIAVTCRVLSLTEPVVGHPMVVVLNVRGDGIATIRETNLVALLERLE
jgi:hypothetical protein